MTLIAFPVKDLVSHLIILLVNLICLRSDVLKQLVLFHEYLPIHILHELSIFIGQVIKQTVIGILV